MNIFVVELLLVVVACTVDAERRVVEVTGSTRDALTDLSATDLTRTYCTVSNQGCQSGNDIVPAKFAPTLRQCSVRCSQHPQCLSVLWDANKHCHMKDGRCPPGHLVTSPGGTTLYRLRKGESCPEGQTAYVEEQHNYSRKFCEWKGKACPGHNLYRRPQIFPTYEDCLHKCARIPSCAGADYKAPKCEPKDYMCADEELVDDPEMHNYMRLENEVHECPSTRSPTPPEHANNDHNKGSDHEGGSDKEDKDKKHDGHGSDHEGGSDKEDKDKHHDGNESDHAGAGSATEDEHGGSGHAFGHSGSFGVGGMGSQSFFESHGSGGDKEDKDKNHDGHGSDHEGGSDKEGKDKHHDGHGSDHEGGSDKDKKKKDKDHDGHGSDHEGGSDKDDEHGGSGHAFGHSGSFGVGGMGSQSFFESHGSGGDHAAQVVRQGGFGVGGGRVLNMGKSGLKITRHGGFQIGSGKRVRLEHGKKGNKKGNSFKLLKKFTWKSHSFD